MAGKLDLLNTNGVIINAQNKKVPITIYHFKFKKPQINKDIQAGKDIVVINLWMLVWTIGTPPSFQFLSRIHSVDLRSFQ